MKPDIRRRDGLARGGMITAGTARVPFPAALDTGPLFPALMNQQGTNVPLGADPAFARTYILQPEGTGEPVIIHPALPTDIAHSGDCVVVANWHTVMDNPRQYVDYLVILKEKTRPDTLWYAPAAALPSNVHILCYSGFDLFDYRAADLRTAQQKFCMPEGEFPASAMEEMKCGCEGCRAGDLRMHNRLALDRELAVCRLFISQGQLRELVESRCRLQAPNVAILRRLDTRYSFVERSAPVVRGGILKANSGESMNRPEVRRFMERVLSRYIPPKTDVAVLLPCSARKPYSLSQTHRRFCMAIDGRAHELIVTSPLGLVPRELETVYPAMHYDVPVTGFWDAEERAVIAGVIAQYFKKHHYRRVIAHLEGGARAVVEMAAESAGITPEYSCREDPASGAALNNLDNALAGERRVRDDRLHGICSYQFNVDLDPRPFSVRGTFPELFYSRNRVPCFSLDTAGGMLRPTFDGWSLIPEGYRITIDDFIPEGDILAPGVTGADTSIRDGDEVLVTGPRAIATGRAAMSGDEMVRSGHGVAVRVRKVKRI
ncbi:MAG TPA: archaeosine synthase subunit alpha [Methanoregulaceae archaeon]|nr:archaeosine synthase subunit alpha [Methanoregulaceae archaeon]HRY74708.1 archaeosine synthase subunit alpha [Methanoregulaceae archaeon]